MADNVNWYSSNLPQASAYNFAPPADRAKLLADQLVLQQGSSDTPIYSPWAGLAKMGASALGGYLQGTDIKRVQDQQNAAMQQFARVYGMAPGSAAATTDPNDPNAPNAPTAPAMTPAQIAQMLPNMATSPTGADTTATPTALTGTGATMPAALAGGPQQANWTNPGASWSDPGNPPAPPPPSPDPTQKTAQISPEDMPARQAVEAASGDAQAANIPLPADWLPSQTTGAASLPSMAAMQGQGVTMPPSLTGMPNPADVPAPNAVPTAGSVPRSTVSVPPGPPLQGPHQWPPGPNQQPTDQAPTGQAPPPGQPGQPYQFAQPMPPGQVRAMVDFVSNPYAPPDWQQAILQRLLPQQQQRPDGSIVQIDLVHGTMTQIAGPTHHFTPAGRAGQYGLDEPTGQWTARPGAGQTGAPGQTFRTPDGVDMVYDVDGVPKVLDTPHNKAQAEGEVERSKGDATQYNESLANMEELRNSQQTLQQVQTAIAGYGGELPRPLLGEYGPRIQAVLGLNPEKAGKYEEFAHAAQDFMSNQLKAKYGNRVTNLDLQSTARANGGTGVSDMGNRLLFDYAGHSLQLKQAYEAAKQNWYTNPSYMAPHPTRSLEGFEQAWQKSIVGVNPQGDPNYRPLASYPDRVGQVKGVWYGRVPTTDGFQWYRLQQQGQNLRDSTGAPLVRNPNINMIDEGSALVGGPTSQ